MADNLPLLQVPVLQQKLQSQILQSDELIEQIESPLNPLKFNSGYRVKEQLQIIKSIRPSGQTLINDMVVDCLTQIMIMCGIIKEKALCSKYKIVYVAVFDGVDTLSKTKLDVNGKILDLHKICDQYKIQLQFYFMGINLNKQDTVALTSLFNSKSLNFKNVSATPQNMLQCLKYFEQSIFKQNSRKIICFNLDTSASMLGCRWRNVCLGVQQICIKLTSKDLFMITVKQNYYPYCKVIKSAQIVEPIEIEELTRVNIKKSQVRVPVQRTFCVCWKRITPAKIINFIAAVGVVILIYIFSSGSLFTSSSSHFTYQAPK